MCKLDLLLISKNNNGHCGIGYKSEFVQVLKEMEELTDLVSLGRAEYPIVQLLKHIFC